MFSAYRQKSNLNISRQANLKIKFKNHNNLIQNKIHSPIARIRALCVGTRTCGRRKQFFCFSQICFPPKGEKTEYIIQKTTVQSAKLLLCATGRNCRFRTPNFRLRACV